jgi:hypothetical protein
MMHQSNENKMTEGEDFYFTPEGYKCYRKIPFKTRSLLKVAVIVRMAIKNRNNNKK